MGKFYFFAFMKVRNYAFLLYKYVFTALMIISVLLLSSCASEQISLPEVEDYDKSMETEPRYNLKLGVVAGPYGDMFKETILPQLEAKGYTVEIIEFASYSEPNFSLANHEIDMNMFQNYSYLNDFKFKNNLNLSAISEFPTAPMGLYSTKYTSIDEIEDGGMIAIPNDASNTARALSFLDQVNLISVDPLVSKNYLTLDNILPSEMIFNFALCESSTLAATYIYYDMAVINGNFALGSGLSLSEALYIETLSDNHINVIAVRTEDLDELFVKDIIEVLQSDEYMETITDPNGKYDMFQVPRCFLYSRGGVLKR